jgi:hypothetical protein
MVAVPDVGLSMENHDAEAVVPFPAPVEQSLNS